MTNPIIIIGKNGQLGSALAELLGNKAISFSHSQHDFSVYENIQSAFDGIVPNTIINACAYTNVDQAEEEAELALHANEKIPAALAQYCKDNDIPLVHYSTDYVFSGDGDKAYNEDSPTAPINKYGASKLAGEKAITEIGGKYLIFRTSWLYDASHKNFLTTMLNLAQEREELAIVSDQIGAPTFALDLARETLRALYNISDMEQFPSGIYHLCNNGETNWHEYAKQIFAIANEYEIDLQVKKVNAITSDQYPTPAKRPLNSRLDCSKAKSVLNIEMPHWQESLEECMEQVVASNQDTIERFANN